MSAIATRENTAPASVVDVLGAIARAASDPAIDVGKMRELLEMQRQILAVQAHHDATQAKELALAAMPRIDKRGRILVQEKGSRRVIQNTAFAKYEDIADAVVPVLRKHGFTLTHTTEPSSSGGLIVTAVLEHRGPHGVHVERAALPLPPDPSGSKNSVQAIGSALSYGRRYTTTALLNLIFEDEDDDGAGGKEPPKLVNDLQILDIENALRAADAEESLFLRAFKIQEIGDLPAERFDEAIRRIGGPRR